NVKTARSWCGIVPFTHLAREGRMTVTTGRRELLAALGGAAAAWTLAARAQNEPISTSRGRRHWLHGRSACPLLLVAPLNSEAVPVAAQPPYCLYHPPPP